jgi:hypothetical protein
MNATVTVPASHTEASIAALVQAKLTDPWVPADPMIGKQVRYMGREWAYQNTEWTVIGFDGVMAELAKPGSSVGHPFRAHSSMFDVL